MEKSKMNGKNFLVFFLALGILTFVSALVSAAPVGTITKVEINGVNASSNPAIMAGETVSIRVDFLSSVNASNIEVRAEVDGSKTNAEDTTASFDVETGQTYTKTISLDVPFDLTDVLSENANLNIRISGGGFSTEANYALRVQREPLQLEILSVSVPQTATAGQTVPVDFVLKNIGYNNLNDLFVTVQVPSLNIEKTTFVGDLVSVSCDKSMTSVQNYGVNISRKCNEDNVDTASGEVFFQLPYDAKSGTYAVELKADNGDTAASQAVQLNVDNAFSGGNFIVSGNQLLIVNPTSQVVVYRLVPEATNGVSLTLSENLVSVPAGSSQTVTVQAPSSVSGTQVYYVDVFSTEGKLVSTVSFNLASNAATGGTSPVVVLTIILAIIFIVLLVVLIVLLGKKPEKEEFGESYY